MSHRWGIVYLRVHDGKLGERIVPKVPLFARFDEAIGPRFKAGLSAAEDHAIGRVHGPKRIDEPDFSVPQIRTRPAAITQVSTLLLMYLAAR